MTDALAGIDNTANMDSARARMAEARLQALSQKKAADTTAINKVSEDFEAVFLGEMMKPMFEGVNTENEWFGGGHAEEIYKSLLLDEYGKAMAKSGGVGIADYVKKELMSLQHVE